MQHLSHVLKNFSTNIYTLFLVLEYSVKRDQGPCTLLSGLRTLKKHVYLDSPNFRKMLNF